MSIHREMMAMAREQLHDNMGRLASYIPPAGVNSRPSSDISVRWTSAEDRLIETDSGVENMRTVTVSVQIGSGSGMLAAVHRGGVFELQTDSAGQTVPWTVREFANADGEAGWVRCLCVRPIQQTGVVGKTRPRQ